MPDGIADHAVDSGAPRQMMGAAATGNGAQAIDAAQRLERKLARTRGFGDGCVSQGTAFAQGQDASREHLLAHGDSD